MTSDQEFLLYPLDTGEDPACLDCGALMMLELAQLATDG